MLPVFLGGGWGDWTSLWATVTSRGSLSACMFVGAAVCWDVPQALNNLTFVAGLFRMCITTTKDLCIPQCAPVKTCGSSACAHTRTLHLVAIRPGP
jgi:hypothetical protein